MIGKVPKTTNDNQYIITFMDYFSKWPEAEAVKSKAISADIYLICVGLESLVTSSAIKDRSL